MRMKPKPDGSPKRQAPLYQRLVAYPGPRAVVLSTLIGAIFAILLLLWLMYSLYSLPGLKV